MIRVALSEQEMERIAQEFEDDSFAHEDNPVYTGSHYQLANNDIQSVTVVYETKDILQVNDVAHRLGCSTSQLYRNALKQYLQTA